MQVCCGQTGTEPLDVTDSKKLYINMFYHTYAVNIVTTVLMFIPPLHANNANPEPVTKVVAVSCPC